MKIKNTILLLLAVITFTTCMVKYEKGTDAKMKKKAIDGVEYTFLNQTKSVKKRIGLIGNSKLDNIVDFTGLEKPIHKTISKAELKKKVDLGNMEFFYIDSVSFKVNESKDKIDLYYYLNLGNGKKQAVFTLEKVKNKWVLN